MTKKITKKNSKKEDARKKNKSVSNALKVIKKVTASAKDKVTSLVTKKAIDPNYSSEKLRYENPIASREFIIEKLKGKPMNFMNLCRFLKVSADQQWAIKKRLRAMERDGQVNFLRGIYSVATEANFNIGQVSFSNGGLYGFVDFNDNSQSAFLKPRQMDKVLHGDKVEVLLKSNARGGKSEALVRKVLSHEISHILGTIRYESIDDIDTEDSKEIESNTNLMQVYASHRSISRPFVVENIDFKQDGESLKKGDTVYAEIISYPNEARTPRVRVLKRIVQDDTVESITEMAILSTSLPYEWDKELLQECDGLQDKFQKELASCIQDQQKGIKQSSSRHDLRDKPFITIDGEDARDFDDAVLVEKNSSGWKVFVAIADVSFFVTPGSELDKSAWSRGTSVYFPDRVIPMLPEILSNDLCSLKPNEDRFTTVCEMQVSHQGELEKSQFYKAVICSKSRQTYKKVFEFIEGKSSAKQLDINDEISLSIKQMHEMTQILLQKRKDRGALEFDIPEAKVWINAENEIEKLDAPPRNIAHMMIEEAMILANIASAKEISTHYKAGMYRIHEAPEGTKLNNLLGLLKNLNIKISPVALQSQQGLAQLVEKINELPFAQLLNQIILRSMQKAQYSSELKGHFGLALSHYTHFTSPIRRYPDLIVHRILNHLIEHKDPNNIKKAIPEFIDAQELEAMAVRSSFTERRADEAVYQVLDKLKCLYMKQFLGDEFSAMVAGLSSFSIFVQLNDIPVSGAISIRSLPLPSSWSFNESSLTLSNPKGEEFCLGKVVRVKLDSIDGERNSLIFSLVDF